MTPFTESQRFRQWWLWGIVGVSVAFYVGSLLFAETPPKPGTGFGLVPLALVILLLYVWRLDTRIDASGIHYRVFPILPWRTIYWDAITSTTLTQYSFVGYGIRVGWEGWVYNIAGNQGLRIERSKRNILIIGTQRPDELQQWLNQYALVSS